VKTALAVVAGLQITLMTLQVQLLLQRNRENLAATRQSRLVAAIEKLEWMPEMLDRITSSILKVDQSFPGTQIVAAGRSYLERCANDLKELERGHLRIEWEDIDLVLAQTNASRETVRATSVQSVDLSFWLSRAGQRYWQAHLDALQRGITIERIFIYKDWTDELNSLALGQHEAGVDVSRVLYDSLPARLRNDVIIWDESCGYETQVNAGGDGYHNFYTLDGHDISRMLADFRATIGQADPIFEK
jgi:hypothetical protein